MTEENKENKNWFEKNFNVIYLVSMIILFVIGLIFFSYLYHNHNQSANDSIDKAIETFTNNAVKIFINETNNINPKILTNYRELDASITKSIESHFFLLKENIATSVKDQTNMLTFWFAFLSIIMIVFTILGVFMNNSIIQNTKEQSNLILDEMKSKIEQINQQAEDMNTNVETSGETLEKFKKESSEKLNSITEEYNKAIEEMKKRLDNNIKMMNSLSQGLNLAVNNKDYYNAIDMFKKILDSDPENSATNYNIGMCYQNLKNYEEAIKFYEKAININENADTYNNIGICYQELKDYEKAMELYEKAIKYNCNYWQAYYNKGRIYFQKKEYDNAIKYYNESIRLNPNDSWGYMSRGNTYLRKYEIEKNKNDLYEAEKNIDIALSKNNNDFITLTNKGETYIYRYQLENDINLLHQAKEYLEKSEKLNINKQDINETYYFYSLLYKELSKNKKATKKQKEEYKKLEQEYLIKSAKLGYYEAIKECEERKIKYNN